MWRVSHSRLGTHGQNRSVTRATLRNRRACRLAAGLAPVAAALLAAPAIGQTVTWDADPATPATPHDGSGSWNTTTAANWSNGVTDSAWVNGNIANIGS